MIQKQLQKAHISELLEIYAAAAAAHGEATVKGDHRTANEQADIIIAAYRELRARGPKAQRALLGFLAHPNEAVKGMAAAHVLEFAPKRAVPVLESLSKSTSIHGFTARITLEEWKRGRLKFP